MYKTSLAQHRPINSQYTGVRVVLEELGTVPFVMCKMISLQCNHLYYIGTRLSYPLDLLQRAQQMSLRYLLWTRTAYFYPQQEKSQMLVILEFVADFKTLSCH